MTTTTEIKQVAMHQAVEAGAALLDQERPGWADRVDLVKLDLASCAECVLGQLFGDYHNGRYELSGLGGPIALQWALEHGFTAWTPGGDAAHAWGQLQKLWVEQIEARR